MIDLRADHLGLVKQILAEYAPGCEVRAFGSRVRGTEKDHSDLDLVLVGSGPIRLERLYRLQEAFQESDLPFRVDVMDWNGISNDFRRIVDQQYDVVQSAS